MSTESSTAAEAIVIVFDGPPAHQSGRFVEVEDASGASINAGEWKDRGNGLWELRIEAPKPRSLTPDERGARMVKILDALAAGVDSDTTVCTRVWEAWSYGTMGPDDFTPLAEDPDSLQNLADALVKAFPELLP